MSDSASVLLGVVQSFTEPKERFIRGEINKLIKLNCPDQPDPIGFIFQDQRYLTHLNLTILQYGNAPYLRNSPSCTPLNSRFVEEYADVLDEAAKLLKTKQTIYKVLTLLQNKAIGIQEVRDAIPDIIVNTLPFALAPRKELDPCFMVKHNPRIMSMYRMITPVLQEYAIYHTLGK